MASTRRANRKNRSTRKNNAMPMEGGAKIKALVLGSSPVNVALTTAWLERRPGEMLRDPGGVYTAAAQTAARGRSFLKFAGRLRELMESKEPTEVEFLRLSADGKSAIVQWDTGVEEMPTWHGVMAASELKKVRGLGLFGPLGRGWGRSGRWLGRNQGGGGTHATSSARGSNPTLSSSQIC